MIKRQFYALEHLSHNSEASSSSSSSSSDSFKASSSDVNSDDHASSPAPINQIDVSSPEDESADENDSVNPAKLGWVFERDEIEHLPKQPHKEKRKLSHGRANSGTEEYVVMCKNVLKCRLCPKTICLTGDTMRAHLSSQKHARSLKHLEEGTLKLMLNSDGEEEEQGETHAERYARTLASAKEEKAPGTLKRKKSSGRQRQRKRTKRKALLAAKEEGRTVDSANHGDIASATASIEMKGTHLKLKKRKPKMSKLTVNKKILKGKPNMHGGFSA